MAKRNLMNSYYALRWHILERDNFTCQYCGQSAPSVKLEVAHVLPIEEGGTDSVDNLKTACYSCNRGRNSLRVMSMYHSVNNRFYPINQEPSTGLPFSIPNLRPRQTQIYDLLSMHKTGLSAHDLSSSIGISENSIRVALHRLKRKNQIHTGFREGRVIYITGTGTSTRTPPPF